MASKIGLSYRREAEEARLASATNRLASRGVNVGGDPRPTRDPDANAVAALGRTADVLEAAVERIDELRDENERLKEAIDAMEQSTDPDVRADADGIPDEAQRGDGDIPAQTLGAEAPEPAAVGADGKPAKGDKSAKGQ